MDDPEAYQKLLKIIQSISYAVGVIVSAAVLRKVIKASGSDLEHGFDFFKILGKR